MIPLSLVNDIKRDMHLKKVSLESTEYIVQESASDSTLRDAMLSSDRDLETLGAENDPKIEKLIQTIPEYEEEDINFKKKLEGAVESVI